MTSPAQSRPHPAPVGSRLSWPTHNADGGRRLLHCRRLVSGALVALLLPPAVACQSRPIMGGPPDMPGERMVFTPDGRMLLTERPGRIRVIGADGHLDPTPWAVVDDVRARGEGGLMGIALHPDFPAQPWVYVMYTSNEHGGVNRVARIREEQGRGGRLEVILDDLPARANHNGGRIRFGPDGLLYVGAGEVWEKERAQDLDDPAGSVLRIAPDGSIPTENPFAGSPIFSYGHRNVQGIAWHPDTGELFTAEHGPSGEWPGVGGHDEINITERGKNYGWPLAVGAPGAQGLEDPLLMWPQGAPTGDLIFYDGDLMPDLRGDLFYSTLRSEALFRIRFQDPVDPHRPTAIERWFITPEGRSVYGRLRGMVVGPDGALYIGTSNQSRGTPRAGDDRILRVAPSGTGPPR